MRKNFLYFVMNVLLYYLEQFIVDNLCCAESLTLKLLTVCAVSHGLCNAVSVLS